MKPTEFVKVNAQFWGEHLKEAAGHLPVSHRGELPGPMLFPRMMVLTETPDWNILELVGLAPAVVEDVAIDLFAAKGTGVMTNVPGPRTTVTLAGVPLRGTIGWGPTSGDLGLGVAVFSYAGEVTVGLCVDRGLVPDPRGLLDEIVRELEQLLIAHLPLAQLH